MRLESGQNCVLLHSIRKGHARANFDNSLPRRSCFVPPPCKKTSGATSAFSLSGLCVVEYAKTRHHASLSGRHHPGKRTVFEAWICLGPLSPAERGASIHRSPGGD